jgi:hypothetical protein
VANPRLRPTKFTPERIQQIKELIARGASCGEIAAVVGVTVGTLKVTCSRLGIISLRRPKPRGGNMIPPPRAVSRVAGTNNATFTIIVRRNGEERRTDVPLTPAMIGPMALEASSMGLSICEFARELVLDLTRKQLVQRVLDSNGATEGSQSPDTPNTSLM